MTKVAPHLPAPTCSVPLHGRFERAKWLLVASALGLFAGLVGGLIIVDQLYPRSAGGPLYIVNRSTDGAIPTLNADVMRDWRYRRLQIYDATRVVNGVYPESAVIAPAVILNSGGWVVWYNSTAAPLPSTLTAVDWQGITYKIASITRHTNGLVYAKVTGANFRANTTFASWPQWSESKSVWVWGTDWQSHSWKKELSGISGPVDEPAVVYAVANAIPGEIVTTARGELIGFVNKNQAIIPGWMIATKLPELLASGQVVDKVVGWQGEFVTGIETAGVWKEMGGFYVTAVRPRAIRTPSVPQVQKGDVVLLINQHAVTPDSLAYQLATASDEFNVSVWRGGKTIELVVKKELE